MENPKLYRKRFIPKETILLKNDIILFIDNEIIVTKWNTLNPRTDFATGRSCYFLDNNFKISIMFDKNGQMLYYYCDILETKYIAEENAYVFEDLLIDIVVEKDGNVKVLDLAEISEALDAELITLDMAKKALIRSDHLLGIIYSGKFHEFTKYLQSSNHDI